MLESAAAVTGRGRLPIIVYCTLRAPCYPFLSRSLADLFHFLPRLPSRRAPSNLLLSVHGCFINCLSLRIITNQQQRVGGRDKTQRVNQLPPAPLFSLYPTRSALRPSLSLSRFSPRDSTPQLVLVAHTRYNRIPRSVSSRYVAQQRR